MTTSASAPTSLVGRCANDMAERWRRGERPLAEDYFARWPGSVPDEDAALELVAEELALREEFAAPVGVEDLVERFPRWRARVEAIVECQRLLGPPAVPLFPEPGESLGDFHLVAELGRGASARVYLAHQSSLGGREVVLKLSRGGDEHLALARLQHPNIVPLYAACEFPDRGLRGLCLPHLGGGTLAAVLARRIAGTVDSLAACRVAVQLAEALQYAHDRGLLHLDVKPSNVLIAADGTPMLLDFHLARPPLAAGAPPPRWLGGTPGYMAPEHEAAVCAVRIAAPISNAVDARADVYSLGTLLRELLTAGVEQPGPCPIGLRDVLARATANDPTARYATAAEFAVDLRCHIDNRPLRGVRNRSVAERWVKWRRRRPLALPTLLAVGAIVALVIGFVSHTERRASLARLAIAEGERHLASGHYTEAARALRDGERLLEAVPLQSKLRSQLRATANRAECARAADELHTFCERVRPLFVTAPASVPGLHRVERECRSQWESHETLYAALKAQGPADVEEQYRADLLDLAVLRARLTVVTASAEEVPAARRRALELLDRADRTLGTSAVVDLERAEQARALGLRQVVEEATRRAAHSPRRSALDHIVVGRAELSGGNLSQAASALGSAVALEPTSHWANFYRGVCHLRAGRPGQAVDALSACIARRPGDVWCVYTRGLARAELGQSDLAWGDLDRAVALDPRFAPAYLARAALHQRAGRTAEVASDLDRAAGLGAPIAEVEYLRAMGLAADQPAAAAAHARAALAADPNHAAARELAAQLKRSGQ